MTDRAGFLLAALAGLAQTASFAPTEAWPLQIAAIALLAFVLRGAGSARRAAAFGWTFAFTGFVSGLWWLYISMHDFGGMPALLAALAVAVLAALLALYYAAAAAVWQRWSAGSALGLAACWTFAELARGLLLTGFPWNAGGYAHTSGWLSVWAPWIGVYGIGGVAAWLGAAIGLAAADRRLGLRQLMPRLAPPLMLLAAGALLPQDFTRSTGSLRVSLLQTHVAQETKFDAQRIRAHLGALAEQLGAAKGELVVTPESALPLPLVLLDPADWRALTQPFEAPGRGALLGVFLGDDQQGFVNSLTGVSARYAATPQGHYSYGKRHLLPFGEFVPTGFKWFVALMAIPLGDQEPGRSEALFELAGQRLRPLICYEDLFGEDFAASVVGAGSATVLVNVSNLAWFGRHMVQDQHLQASRMRALEFQRPVIRATNTGATAVVDHRGEVPARLAPYTRGVLEASVEGRLGDTPYARWLAAFGLWPLWGVNAGVLGLIVWRRRVLAATDEARTRYR